MLELEDGTEKVCHCIWCGNRCIIVMDKNQRVNVKNLNKLSNNLRVRREEEK